jgi:hypothetical protein
LRQGKQEMVWDGMGSAEVKERVDEAMGLGMYVVGMATEAGGGGSGSGSERRVEG